MQKIKPKHHKPSPRHSLVAAIIAAVGIMTVSGGFQQQSPSPQPSPISVPVPVAQAAAPTATPAATPSSTPIPAKTTPAKPVRTSVPTPPATPVVIPPESAVKYPGLPDYPHPQFEYSTIAMPTGELYSQEGFLGRIGAVAGWDAATAAPGNPPVTVAVIDTGFALQHENLEDRWAFNNEETGALASDGLDNDADGFIDNFRGWDFVHNTNDPAAGTDNPYGANATHGTLTAGLAGLLNPGGNIMPLQVLNDNGSGYTDEVAAAVRYAADHGAKIISLSLGTTADDPYLHQQIIYAVSQGAIVVAAAGNNGCECILYPAAYPEVLAVGASTSTDTPASFSSYGASLDVLAPGTAGDVCSAHYTATNSTSAYSCGYSGTSLAAPIVAGLASLLVQQCPACTPAHITSSLLAGADSIAGMNGAQRTNTTGHGRISVSGAVTALTQPPQNLVPDPIIGDLNTDQAVDVFDLSILLSQWGTSGPSADLNTDGTVNVYDLSIQLTHWTD